MIFGFLRKYMAERDAAIARERDGSQQNNIYEIFQTEPMQRILSDVHDKLQHKEVQQMPKFERKPDLGQLFLVEWDKLPTKTIDGLVMRIYKDQEFFAVNDYLSARLMEVSEELRNEAI